jgi:hypothetical protein
MTVILIGCRPLTITTIQVYFIFTSGATAGAVNQIGCTGWYLYREFSPSFKGDSIVDDSTTGTTALCLRNRSRWRCWSCFVEVTASIPGNSNKAVLYLSSQNFSNIGVARLPVTVVPSSTNLSIIAL